MSRTAGTFFGGDNQPKLMHTDYLAALRNISTAELATKVHGILSYGKIYTKNNYEVTDASGMDAAMALLGLTPQKVADGMLTMSAMKDQRSWQREYESKALEAYRLSLQYARDGNNKLSEQYWKNADAYMNLGDFNYIKRNRIFGRALDENQPLLERVQDQFLRRAPESQYLNRLKALQK